VFIESWNRLTGAVRKRRGGVFGRLVRDRAGVTAIVVALMATSFIGVSGLAVDVGDWFATKRAMQTAADAAAMGGALYLYQNPGASQTVTSNASVAAVNDGVPDTTGFASGSSIYPVTFKTTVTDGGLGSTQTVNVTVTKQANLFLASVLLGKAPPISVTATGYVNNGTTIPTCGGSGCSQSTSNIPVAVTTTSCTGSGGGCSVPQTTTTTITSTVSCNNGSGGCGNTTTTPIQTLVTNGGVQGTGCLTTAGSGAITTSGAVVTDTTACATGTPVNGTGALFCGPDGKAGASSGQETKCPGVPESLGMNPPSPSSGGLSCQNSVSITRGSQTLSPGIYYGGITASGTASLTLQPGVYVMYDGPFSFTSSGTLDGSSGVTIYFTGSGGSGGFNNYHGYYDHNHNYQNCNQYYNQGNPNNSTLLDVEPSSGGSATITAPTTGTTAGVAVSVDNGTTTSGSQGGSSTQMCNGQPMNSTVGGKGSVDVTGVTYLGSHNLTVSGSGNVNSNASYTMIEAGNVTINKSGGTLSLPAYTSSSSVPLPSGYSFNVPVVALMQ